jgi:hypothetical protein
MSVFHITIITKDEVRFVPAGQSVPAAHPVQMALFYQEINLLYYPQAGAGVTRVATLPSRGCFARAN